MNAVDTNVLLYFVDNNEPVKQQQAVDLLTRLSAPDSRAVLLWQVAIEFVAGLKRRENLGKGTVKDTADHWSAAQALLPLSLHAAT